MADSLSTDWSQFYRSLGAMPDKRDGMLVQQTAAPGLSTNKVQTVAVDPFTGSPVVATPQGNTATRQALTQQQMKDMRDPGYDTTRESIVPGGTRTELGYQSGQSFPPSFRLTPQSGLSNDGGAVAAIEQAAPRQYVGKPHMAILKPKPSLEFGSATPGGLSFNTKFNSAVRTAALHQQVGLPPPNAMQAQPSTANPQVAAAMAAKPPVPPAGTVQSAANGYIYTADGRGNWVQTGKVNPALTPSQQYAAAAAAAHRPTNAAERMQAASSGGGFDGSGGGGGLT